MRRQVEYSSTELKSKKLLDPKQTPATCNPPVRVLTIIIYRPHRTHPETVGRVHP